MMGVFGVPETLRYQCFAWRNDDGDIVDMVEVVRCKDCEYQQVCRSVNQYLGCNGYCSRGKRKVVSECRD